MSDLIRAVSEITRSAPAYAKARNYYVGSVDEVFASALIKRLIGSTAKEYRTNLARRVVDAVLDRLKIASVSVPDNDLATRRLNAIWDRNRLGKTIKTLHRTTLSEGDGYLFVWDDPEDEGNAEIHFRTPATTRVFYDPEQPFRKTHAAFVWEVGDGDSKRLRVNLLYRDRIERYITKPGMKGDTDAEFERFLDDDQDPDDWEIPNPHDEVPVFRYRCDDTGRPEHADAFGPQNAINKLVAMHLSTVDFQGFPQRYRLRANTIKDQPASPYPDEDEDTDTEADELDERLEGGPGTVWDLSDTDSVGTFPAAEGKGFTDGVNFYARVMGASTATPLRFLDPSGALPSGESLRADDAPLSEKIGDRQTWLGDEHRDMLRFALKVAGMVVDTVVVAWKPVQIVSDLQGWQTVKAKIEAGVPQKVALAEAGYRPEEVEEWLKGSETTNLATRVALVSQVAAAVTGLTAAMTAGVVTQEQVQRLVGALLDDATEDDDPDPEG